MAAENSDDIDAAWARIVAELESDGELSEPSQPADGSGPRDGPGTTGPEQSGDSNGVSSGLAALFEPLARAERQELDLGAAEPTPDAYLDNWADEGRFVPPAPPELPEGTPIKRLGWAGTLGGPAILLVTALSGWDAPRVVQIAAGLAFLAGFATLVWQLPDQREDGWDDGAKL